MPGQSSDREPGIGSGHLSRLPRSIFGWDVFCWIGHRRFSRHWSVPQIRGELQDSYQIRVSDDAIEDVIARYQAIVAAREQDPERLAEIYEDVDDVVLSIDGLQPEKGHETLYVVREFTKKRVSFGEPLVSSSAAEVRRLVVRAREWAERLGKKVRLWISDKQDAFLTGIAAEFPDVPHRLCQNHFLRDVAQPMLEADSHAKVPTPVAPTPQPHAESTLNKETTSTSRRTRIPLQRFFLARQRAVVIFTAGSSLLCLQQHFTRFQRQLY